MGAFMSDDVQAYRARYCVQKRAPGYQSIRTGPKSLSQKPRTKKKNAGVWCVRAFDSLAPSPRVGHCTCVLPQHNRVVICYGITPDDQILGDFWVLDLGANRWRQMAVSAADASPRFGARSVLVGDEVWIFGGTDDASFLADLHAVSVVDGAVRRPQTTGEAPSPRTNHVMAYANGKLLVYSGTDATVLTDMFVLEMETMEWSKIRLNHGRSAAAYAIADSKLFVFGASQFPGFLVFDFALRDAEMLNVSGVVPPSTVTNAFLIPLDRFILLVGGDSRDDNEDDMPFAPIHVYSIDLKKWSVLPILPDNKTTSSSDGYVDKNGNFLCPLCSQYSVVYNDRVREVVIFLGSPPTNPPISYVIKVGNPLALLHHQNDMISMFNKFA